MLGVFNVLGDARDVLGQRFVEALCLAYDLGMFSRTSASFSSVSCVLGQRFVEALCFAYDLGMLSRTSASLQGVQ